MNKFKCLFYCAINKHTYFNISSYYEYFTCFLQIKLKYFSLLFRFLKLSFIGKIIYIQQNYYLDSLWVVIQCYLFLNMFVSYKILFINIFGFVERLMLNNWISLCSILEDIRFLANDLTFL